MTNEFNPDWMCVCGDLTTLGVVHRKDGPCYMPEPNREWVGLTDEEKKEGVMLYGMTYEQIEVIEATLKEKNT